MHRARFFFLVLIISVPFLNAQSQPAQPAFSQVREEYIFKTGLIADLPSRYGREAVYTDELAYRLYSKELPLPRAGGKAGTTGDGQPMIWEQMDIDSNFRLRPRVGRALSGAPAGPGVRAGATRGGLSWGNRTIYLSYTSRQAQTAILSVKGNSSVFVNGVLHTGDPYNMGFLYLPIPLKKGLNEFFLRGSSAEARLLFPSKQVMIQGDDLTLPHIVPGLQQGIQEGAVVIMNAGNSPLKGLTLQSNLGGQVESSALPDIPAMTTRKIVFRFNSSEIREKGIYACRLQLSTGKRLLDERDIRLEAVGAEEAYSSTFTSELDGSLQYYAVRPQLSAGNKPAAGNALFLSVHGAGVEAIGQARAYRSKDWGTLVAATNRRPRGFNWEDWGRLDALEVLDIARKRFQPDPQKIYLTGHSMGGHGTWFLGATYPDRWAAIAPCAGYPTLKGYGSADGLIPDSSGNPQEQLLLRSGNQSDVIKLASNYKHHGVYIFHGDDDRTVSVRYARQMRGILGDFHTDLSYYEYPGGSHWFGDHSVDWGPLFDFFKWHRRLPDSTVHAIDFTTANPGISATSRWVTILQQSRSLEYSRVQLSRNLQNRTITGSTQNARVLELDLADFPSGSGWTVQLDSGIVIKHTVANQGERLVLEKTATGWRSASRPAAWQKGPHRYGTLKDAFNHRMVFVVGTNGTREENEWNRNKAIYDAETWYYRGNGAVDIITDKEYSTELYKDRGVILFGNKSNNVAWSALLSDCPIQVERNQVSAGGRTWKGDDLAAYFVWPIKGSDKSSVAVITGTGKKGMQAATANQYFAGASGFPDFMIFGFDILHKGAAALKLTGFFDHEWKLADDQMAVQE